jgi:predicted nucleic acid-binding Zn ribbon protein
VSDEQPGPDLARAMLEQARARARRRATEPRPKPDRKRTGGDPQSFGAAIEAFLRARGWENESRVHSVLARWPEIAGPEVADHCTPTSLRDGELVLAAESTAWATQLRLMSRQIQERVNADLGAAVVTTVRVNGPSSGRARAPGEWRVRGGRGERDTYG